MALLLDPGVVTEAERSTEEDFWTVVRVSL